MKKKFLKVALFSLVMSLSVTTVGCKDYDDDIVEINDKNDKLQEEFNNKLEQQVTALNSKIEELKSAQTSLQAEAARANEAAAKAASAATAAQKTGDEALAQAMAANAQAEAALAAVAEAKDAAIAETIKQIEALKADIESQIAALRKEFGENFDKLAAAINDCVTKDDFNAAVQELNDKIAALNNLSESDVNAIIKKYLEDIGLNETTISGINGKITGLTDQVAAIDTTVGGNTKAIANLMDKVIPGIKKELEDKIAALNDILLNHIIEINKYQTEVNAQLIALNEFKDKYETLLAGLDEQLKGIEGRVKDAEDDIVEIRGLIENLTGTDTGIITKLQGTVKEQGDAIAKIKGDITALQQAIKSINDKLSTLNAINAKRLTSVTLIPTAYRDGIPTIEFFTAHFKAQELDKETGLYSEPTKAENIIINSKNSEVLYRLNPAGVTLDDIVADNVSFVQQIAASRAADENVIKVTKVDKNENGQLVVLATKTTDKNVDNAGTNKSKIYTVALRVPIAEKNYYKWTEGEGDEAKVMTEAPEDAVVYSEYARVSDTDFTPSIAYAKDITNSLWAWPEVKTKDKLLKIPYNTETDLNTIVTGVMNYGDDKHIAMDETDMSQFGLSLECSVFTQEYKVDGVDQQLFAKVTDNKLTPVTPQGTKELDRIGKTPVIAVVMKDADNNVVSQRFFKAELAIIGAKDVFNFELFKEPLNCKPITKYNVTWKQVNDVIIAQLGFPMTKAEFVENYAATTVPAGVTVDLDADDKTAPIEWTVNVADKILAGKDQRLTKEIKFTNAAGLYPDLTVTLEGTITWPKVLPALGTTVPAFWNNGVMRVLPVALKDAISSKATYDTNILQGRPIPYLTNLMDCSVWDIQFSTKESKDGYYGYAFDNNSGVYNLSHSSDKDKVVAAELWYNNEESHVLYELTKNDASNPTLENIFHINNNSNGIALVNSGATIDLIWTVALTGKEYDNIATASGTCQLQIVKPLQKVTPSEPQAITQNATEQTVTLGEGLIVTDVFGKEFEKNDEEGYWNYYGITDVIWGGKMTITDNGKTYSLDDFKFAITVSADGKLTYDGGGAALNHAVTLNIPVVVKHMWGELESEVHLTINPGV